MHGWLAAIKRWYDGLPYEQPDYRVLPEERASLYTAPPEVVPEPVSKPQRKPKLLKRLPRLVPIVRKSRKK